MPAPIEAPSSTVHPLAISASSPTVAPCTTHRWATVAPAPISVGVFGWPVQDRPVLDVGAGPHDDREKSARSTAPYQTEAPASMVTSPTSVAVGATKASGCTVGAFPSKLNSGMPGPYAVGGRRTA